MVGYPKSILMTAVGLTCDQKGGAVGAEERKRRLEALDFALDRTVNAENHDCFSTLQDMFYELQEEEQEE